ncbi:DUF1289 domain-containing protein [Pseudovibrio sp. Alg231-02]|uniref:DUF1289 domain-containing protein n=1 Tax=Pseudovibrio sp. Alg231-02 TaxID=1922223 RepID=UPI001900C9E5|nr:DUF1289 domain-containing protein [Pseudovibrio sp. Alg231-02]
MSVTLEPPASPCLKLCKLDEDRRMCVSCWRLLSEISGWGSLSAQAQHDVLAKLPARKARFLTVTQEDVQCAGR